MIFAGFSWRPRPSHRRTASANVNSLLCAELLWGEWDKRRSIQLLLTACKCCSISPGRRRHCHCQRQRLHMHKDGGAVARRVPHPQHAALAAEQRAGGIGRITLPDGQFGLQPNRAQPFMSIRRLASCCTQRQSDQHRGINARCSERPRHISTVRFGSAAGCVCPQAGTTISKAQLCRSGGFKGVAGVHRRAKALTPWWR